MRWLDSSLYFRRCGSGVFRCSDGTQLQGLSRSSYCVKLSGTQREILRRSLPGCAAAHASRRYFGNIWRVVCVHLRSITDR